jgi:DNA-binding NarL/FixJ family response regulator
LLQLVRSVVGKEASAQEVLAALERFAQEEHDQSSWPAPSPAASPETAQRAAPTGALQGISKRKVDILRHLTRGLTDREIGVAVSLSEHTIDHHLSGMRELFGIDNRVELAALAGREGLYERVVEPREPAPRPTRRGRARRR